MDKLKQLPRVSSHSGIDGNGQEHISIVLKEPQIDARNLWHGGLFLNFKNNYKRHCSEAHLSRWLNGAPQYIRPVKTWKNETLAESECVRYANEFKEDKQNV